MNKDGKLPESGFTDQEAVQALREFEVSIGGFGGLEMDIRAHEKRGLSMDLFIGNRRVVEIRRQLDRVRGPRDILADPNFFKFALDMGQSKVEQKVNVVPEANTAEQLGLTWEVGKRIIKDPNSLLKDLGRDKGHVLWRDFLADEIPAEEVPGLERAISYGCVHTYILRESGRGKATDEKRVAIILPNKRVPK